MDHLEFAAYESASLDSDAAWLRWVARFEELLGGNSDGEGREGEADYNGYSLDEALDRCEAGKTADAYYAEVIARPGFNVRPHFCTCPPSDAAGHLIDCPALPARGAA